MLDNQKSMDDIKDQLRVLKTDVSRLQYYRGKVAGVCMGVSALIGIIFHLLGK